MQEIQTDRAPDSIGPYSQGIVDDGTIYVSGQGPVDPESGEIVGDTIEEQTERTLQNIEAILDAAGASLGDVRKATVYVRDMRNYDAVNEVYGSHMSAPYPARTAVEVDDLPIDIGVEIDVFASAP